MRIAIMQPYLFPYLGYFQLMNAADKFLLLDDANYIKRGWVNRNNILLQEKPFRFTLPLQKVSQFKKINETLIATDTNWRKSFMASLYMAYHKSVFYNDISEMIRGIIYSDEPSLSVLLHKSLQLVADYIGIKTPMISLSSSVSENSFKGEERILHLCSMHSADEYINLPGGRHLYSAEHFYRASVRLLFIEPHLPAYSQLQQGAFVPGLSIIDVLMNNPTDSVLKMAQDYDIVPG